MRPGSQTCRAHIQLAAYSRQPFTRWRLQEEDRDGVLGVNLSKELISVAGRTLKANITKLAPQILPISEKLAFVHNLFLRKVTVPAQS